MAPPSQDNAELLRRLLDAEVELVVIGGIAAIAWGSQQLTKDLDVTAPFTVENIEKLMRVVRPLEPRLGIVDVLSKVPPVGDYDRVASKAKELEIFGRRCRVISIDDLIAVKAHVARPKDKLVEAELRAIRDRLASP
jgi:predicted nucleotidyltransferase